MKNIIERNLPLNVKYTLINKAYVPLSESSGTICDNCNRLIANMATVRSETHKVYTIGFDCLETCLINNQLLDKMDIAEYERVKPMFNKIIRASKKLKETIDSNPKANITGIRFEPHTNGEYFPYYWLTNNQTTGRQNDYIKLKDMDFKVLIDTLRNIFSNLQIIAE